MVSRLRFRTVVLPKLHIFAKGVKKMGLVFATNAKPVRLPLLQTFIGFPLAKMHSCSRIAWKIRL